MNGHLRTLLTIFTEASVEMILIRDIEKLGAHGYTITDARGKGGHGVRDAEWDMDSNIRVEVICTRETATAIAEHLREKYYENYAMVIYSHDVAVLRPEKF